jgi:hypothetical protein
VADRDQEKDREHLTEREREALKIFAREFVREAGLQQTPKQEQQAAWLEGEKLLHETAKTQVLITAGLLGASGAAWFIPEPKHVWLLGLAVVLGITSMGQALAHMSLISNDVRRPSDIRTFTRWPRDSSDLLSTATFTVASFFLSAYLIYNI